MKEYIVNFPIIKKSIENNMKKQLIQKGEFGKLNKKKLEKIRRKIDNNLITLKILSSYRSLLLKQKVVSNYSKLRSNINLITKEYKNNDILYLANKYDNSPMTILRLLIKKNYPKIKSLKSSLDILSERDRQQLELAEANDIVAPLNQDESAIRSLKYEQKIQKSLDKKGIKYKIQEDLVEEQKIEFGRPMATPDFLLDETIKINGNEVNWIEVKNFYGSSSNFMFKKIKKQVEKYKKRWGSGCLVFKYGIGEDLIIKDVCVISF
jgi:hypothetical protein